MPRSINVRLDLLETTVAEMSDLPAQVHALSSQIVQLGRELHDEISAVRADMSAIATELRGEMSSMATELRGEMSSIATELRGEMSSMATELRREMSSMRDELRSEMSSMAIELRGEMSSMRNEIHDELSSMRTEFAGAFVVREERLVAHMRTLHEDVLQRITLLGEARQVRRSTGKKTPRRKQR